ncbi:MAG: ATP-binding cassette domain-containing protein, partial [Candidatus Pacebacteria bacterium]|nr:ATP-binding cassette domain-containing protein [Candidatus Paceibacterota bacterium]
MTSNESIISFKKVSFGYVESRPLLDEVDFSVHRGTKTTIMGQNGAGKSTIFKLITKEIRPEDGVVNIVNNLSIAISRQVIPQGELDLTVKEFFEKAMSRQAKEKIYNIDPKIDEILEAVNFKAPHDKIMRSFSGGQQARLLLASALIQAPDLLLLDEPTNNLDKAGIEHLTKFLIDYDKTCIVISHDADFLNSFTDGVLYLDIFTKKIEQYRGNY